MNKIHGTDFTTQTGRVIFAFVTVATHYQVTTARTKEAILRDLLRLEKDSFSEKDFQIAITDLYALRAKNDTVLYDVILHEAVLKTARALDGFSKVFYAYYFDPFNTAISYESFMLCLHADTSFTPSGLKKNVDIIRKELDRRVCS